MLLAGSLLTVRLLKDKEVTVAFVGDILLDRGVGKMLQLHGMDYPYEKVKDILQEPDILMGNLEGPLTGENAGVMKNSRLLFRANPMNALSLKNAGFTILNLANNHAMDFGKEGLTDTLEALKKSGIRTVGAGKDADAALEPVFLKAAGITLGFVGYSTFPAEGYFFSADKPDVAHPAKEQIMDQIKRAKLNCDLLVVSFHWGREFDFYPGEQQKILAHEAVDNGADLVVGHHPHVLQGIEKYKGKLVFYSLGNFIFDRQIPAGTDETIVPKLIIKNGEFKKAEILPIMIREGRPEPAGGQEAKRILERLLLYSEGFGTEIYPEGDAAYIEP